MKKYSKIMMQALSIASIFALTNNCSIKAIDPIADQTNLALTAVANTVLPDKADTKDGEKRHKEGKHSYRREHKENNQRWHEKDMNDDERSAEHFEEKISKLEEKSRKNPSSLYNQFLKIKNTDAAKPKSLKDIASIADDSMRRAEIFKYIEASEGQTISAEDKEAFKQMLTADFKATRGAYAQVKELLGHMAYEKNYALMSEEELMNLYHEKSHHHEKDKKGYGKHRYDSDENKPERRRRKEEHTNKDSHDDEFEKKETKSWHSKANEDHKQNKSNKKNKKPLNKKNNKKVRKNQKTMMKRNVQPEKNQAIEVKK
jgi:hypothetical protein